MIIDPIWALRLLGISGILGSVLFIIGDLLYHHIPGSSNSPTVKMSMLPESRLLNAGTLGLIGCWFYTLASMHIYLAFQPAGELFALVLLAVFAVVMICYGITHTAYFSIAASAKIAARVGTDVESGAMLGSIFFQRLVTITYLPVVIASSLMIYGIITGRSLYPVWMVLFLPIIIYLLKTPVIRVLKGRLKEIIKDSYDNIVLFAFFSLSTVLLW
jgi:hypothetical protein